MGIFPRGNAFFVCRDPQSFFYINRDKIAEVLRENVLHCAARALGGNDAVSVAVFYFVRFPQALLALLASHGVTEVTLLRSVGVSRKRKNKKLLSLPFR